MFISGKGLLIAGGVSDIVLDVVEMLDLDTMTTCVLDVKLDEPKYFHTGDGHLVCGGTQGDAGEVLSNCYNILTKTTFNLYNNNKREGHTSWSTDEGIYLLGGFPSSTTGRTTELITGDSVQEGFPLKYDTKYAYQISLNTIVKPKVSLLFSQDSNLITSFVNLYIHPHNHNIKSSHQLS